MTLEELTAAISSMMADEDYEAIKDYQIFVGIEQSQDYEPATSLRLDHETREIELLA